MLTPTYNAFDLLIGLSLITLELINIINILKYKSNIGTL